MKKKKILVSVIVPVYNAEKYIERCISSICVQTYNNIEILLINDGSKDSSGALCEKAAEADERIRVFHKENGGLVSAWQYGLVKSSEQAEFVVFVDADDWIEKRHISAMIDEECRTDADIVVTEIKQVYADKIENIPFAAEAKFYNKNLLQEELYPIMINAGRFEFRGISVSRCGKLIRKELLLRNIQYCVDTATFEEDLNIMLPVFMDMSSISIITDAESAYCYLWNESSMLHSYDKKKIDSILSIYPMVLRACREKKKELFLPQIYAEYLSAVVRCYANELRCPGQFQSVKKSISRLCDNEIFKKSITAAIWKSYPAKYRIILHILSQYHSFSADIVTRIMRIGRLLHVF